MNRVLSPIINFKSNAFETLDVSIILDSFMFNINTMRFRHLFNLFSMVWEIFIAGMLVFQIMLMRIQYKDFSLILVLSNLAKNLKIFDESEKKVKVKKAI